MFTLRSAILAYFSSIERRRVSAVKRAASVTVESLEGRTLFTVTPDPGSTFATAFNVGDLNGERDFKDAVAGGDLTDAYKFALPRGGIFSGALQPTSALAELDLYQETIDGNGQLHE